MASKSRFREFKVLFLLTGNPILSDIKSKWYPVYSAATLLCVALTSFTMTLDPLMNLNNIQRCMESARVVVPMFICIWIHVMRLKKRQLVDLLRLTDEFMWEDLPARGMAAYMPIIQKYSWQSTILILCSHALHQCVRLTTHEERPLVYNAWFPFDTSNSPVFELVYLAQTITTVWFTVSLTAFISLYAMLVAIGCTQLQKLNAMMMNPVFDLKQCIHMHQKVKSLLKNLQETYSLVLLGPVLLISVGMCINTFSILVGNAMDALQAMTLILALMSQLSVYCWFGNQLTQETVAVREAMWGSNWVGADISKQKSLVFMLMAADEFVLSAGSVFPMSRHTLMQILNQTYSFFMFLLNFMDN